MTRLGLLSDSHGDAAVTRRAVALLLKVGVDHLLYLGDVGTTQVLDALAVVFPEPHPKRGERVPVHVVFGNTDDRPQPLIRYAQDLGLEVGHPAGRLKLDNKTVAYTHGHLGGVMDQAVADGCDYLLHGHTHLAADDMAGQTRVICPGALTRAQPLSVAILSVGPGVLQTMPLPDGPG